MYESGDFEVYHVDVRLLGSNIERKDFENIYKRFSMIYKQINRLKLVYILKKDELYGHILYVFDEPHVRILSIDYTYTEREKLIRKRAKKFKQIAGPFKKQADNSWICRIDRKKLTGSDHWIIQIRAVDKNGNPVTAHAALTLP